MTTPQDLTGLQDLSGLRRPTLRLGIIGLGSYFRYAYLARLRESTANYTIEAICQRDRTALDTQAGELGDPTRYTVWQDLLRQPGLDAVLISTPHDLHAIQVRAALERRLHVLVDKPLCLDAAEAEDLVRLARQQRRVLSVAYNYHYWSHFQAARALIRDGYLGKLTAVACLGTARAEGSPILDPQSWYHDPQRSGGGSLVSGGTHRLTAVLWLTGLRPDTIIALMAGPAEGLDYQAGLLARLDQGVVATVLNEGQAPEWRLEISIFGERGALFIRNRELIWHNADGERQPVALPPEMDALADFYHAVVEGRPLLTSAEDGYWAVAAVEAAYQSASSGQPCQVRPLQS